MAHEQNDYETAKRSLQKKLLPGLIILIILAICIFLMIERKNAPVPPNSRQAPAATH
jgi:hypothetical protein